MKTRYKYKLQYTIKEFKTEKVEDKDMDLRVYPERTTDIGQVTLSLAAAS
jgi:hypothetical protein